MKRYYLDKLNILESVIKSILINLLITLFLIIVIMLSNIESYYWIIYVLSFVYVIVILINVFKSFKKFSFYVIGRSIMYCTSRKEEKIELEAIKQLEEYYGVNYLFGYKTIIIHMEKSKFYFVFKKKRADKFLTYLKLYVDSDEDLNNLDI